MNLPAGVYYPVLTPFTKEDDVDHETLHELTVFGIERGVHGIFALGSSGQGPAMPPEKRKRALQTIVDAADGRVPVIAHVGTPAASSSVELARHAAAIGADMIAVLPPYFYTDHSESEVQAHYERIADAVDFDVMVYNNPKYVEPDMTPARIQSLTETVPSVTGIKASFTSASTLIEYVERTPEGFDVFAGSIGLLLPGLYHGVSGSIHPPSSPFPEVATSYWDAIQDERVQEAVEYQRLLHDISSIVQRYSADYGRAVYVSLFELRGIEIERYPLWEHEGTPQASELAADLQTLPLDSDGIDLKQG